MGLFGQKGGDMRVGDAGMLAVRRVQKKLTILEAFSSSCRSVNWWTQCGGFGARQISRWSGLVNVVWFKRDLRAHDHRPLTQALERGTAVGLFIIEPAWLSSAEFGWDHLRFAFEALEELRDDLLRLGVPLLIRVGEAREIFDSLHRQRPIQGVFSHEETGLDWSFKRDRIIKSWCKQRNIPWTECLQFGVVRALKNRDEWAAKRSEILERPMVQIRSQSKVELPWDSVNLPWDLLKGQTLKANAQRGGRGKALSLLDSFLSSRGIAYTRLMSSPMTAFDACSRLSPYIAWGQVSLTEIHHAVQARRKTISHEPSEQRRLWQMSLKSFESRLWWHCHFIQKLESEPEIEFRNFNREFDGMRESEWNEANFQAWCRGETGFPMIDACMRALLEYGWINFRMRAMLMSFASYQLWLHWKKPAEFLARHFLDFEPGIHYSQAQMQSGVTGINTIRIYSPKKQQMDQDPDGDFVRRHIPQLAPLSNADLMAPHQIPPLSQIMLNFIPGRDYPLPIVDPDQSYKAAKERVFAWKTRPKTKAASEMVLRKHGSRRERSR